MTTADTKRSLLVSTSCRIAPQRPLPSLWVADLWVADLWASVLESAFSQVAAYCVVTGVFEAGFPNLKSSPSLFLACHRCSARKFCLLAFAPMFPDLFCHRPPCPVTQTASKETPFDQGDSPVPRCIWRFSYVSPVDCTACRREYYPFGAFRFFSTCVKTHSVL